MRSVDGPGPGSPAAAEWQQQVQQPDPKTANRSRPKLAADLHRWTLMGPLRKLRDEEVLGSNPGTPTQVTGRFRVSRGGE